MNKLMDGYDVVNVRTAHPMEQWDIKEPVYNTTYRVFRYEKPKVGKPIKVYKFGYPDYKSMLKKHPELK